MCASILLGHSAPLIRRLNSWPWGLWISPRRRPAIKDLAPTIALPYTVGPGTLWTSILMGHRYSTWQGFALIGGVPLVNTAVLLCAKVLFDHASGRGETMLGKYFAVLMRTMALLVVGVGVEKIPTGIEAAFHLAPSGAAGMGATL